MPCTSSHFAIKCPTCAKVLEACCYGYQQGRVEHQAPAPCEECRRKAKT